MVPVNRKRRKRKSHRVAARTADRAWEAVERGDVGLALKEAARAAAKAPESPAAWTDYGRILALADRLSEAERVLRKAVLIAPSYAEAHVHLAGVLARKGLTINAALSMRRAVELRPEVALYRELLARYEALLPEAEHE